MRIGSLFTGTGALDMAVQEVFGGTVAWHVQYDPADKHQWAAQLLAHHWPNVPNHGDVTRVDFRTVERVDVLTGGFPCTDVSLAGQRAGLTNETRSGLWFHMARAIRELRPRLVVIENVEGLLSAKAVRSEGDAGLEPRAGDLGPGVGSARPLRALGAVLGDLAELGFDAEWARVAASEVGAPHQRKRVFILAWRAVQDADLEPGDERWLAAPRQASGRGPRPDACGRGGASVAHPDSQGLARWAVEPHGAELATAERGGGESAWGRFEPAVTRWEGVTGRAAPGPVDGRGRLAPEFVEWVMGLPEGHVTSVPDMPRKAQLKALGNGVVPQQAAAALRLLLARASAEATA